jgi:hypothetical protein
MNCQEVMEYMQRELDGDLGEIESATLREHIRHCADCAAMYERLKRLSAELESLPKVTPPFSLVDAILPKLDEIDRANAAAASADAGTAGHAGAAGRVGAVGQAGAAGSAQAEPTEATRRRVSRFNLRMLGGVVAAGIVAGIFLVTYNQERLNDSLSGNSAGMSSASSASSSAESMLMMSFSADTADSFEVADQHGSLPNASMKFGPADDGAESGPATESTPGSAPGPAGQPAPADGGINAGEDAGNAATLTSGSDAAGADAGSGAGESGVPANDLPQNGEEAVGVADMGEEPAVGLGEGPLLGIAGFEEEPAADTIESVSPDGAWIAVFSGSRLIIRDRDGNTWFEGEEREGAVTALGWTEDGAFFRYELLLEDGSTAVFLVDPASGEETREQA